MLRKYGHTLVIVAVLVLAIAATASAQVTLGDASMNLDGSASTGYSGSFGNLGPSSHGIGFGGTGNLSGFYYVPQFLSFNVSPFFNESRNNSTFQSITDSSGVTSSANIFGGSKYPGYVNYSYVYNSESNYLLPGIANYRTNANSQTFGIGWSGHPTDSLSFTGGYQGSTSDSSIYGTTNDVQSDFHSLFGTVNYIVDGVRMSGGVRYSNGNYVFPEFAGSASTQSSQVDTTTYDFNVSRSFARYSTSTWLSYSRDTTNYSAFGTKNAETDNVVTGGVSLKPTEKLTANVGGDYDDNLAESLYQAVNGAGAVLPLALPSEASSSWGVYGEAQYQLLNNLYVTGNVEHREQLFLGNSIGATAYGAGVGYGRHLFGGQFTAATTVTRSGLGNNEGSLVGLLSNAIYTRQIGEWNVSGSLGYTRNVDTFLIGYTSSGYSYSGSVSRRIGKVYWNGTASGSRSYFSNEVSLPTYTQSYSTGISYHWIGISGSYSRSSGTGLYTAQGIATSPSGLPPTLLASAVLYGGTSYTIGVGANPFPGLTFSGSFVTSRSTTDYALLPSSNHIEEANAYLQYEFRKVFFTAGYSRLLQGFSASASPPALVSTYYFGLSRWFHLF
jgi:hypothetical protein